MIREWSLVDFVLVMLGGLLGGAVFSAIGIVVTDEELFIVLALAGQFVGHLFVLWLLARTRSDQSLGFEVRGRDALYIVAGIGLQLGLSILFLPLVLYLFPDGGPAQEIGSVLSELNSDTARISSLLISVVLAPVTEELAFRGVLIKALGDRSKTSLMVWSAGIFVLFHAVGLVSGSFFQAAAIVLPQLFIVGLVLAWVTLRNERLGPAIFIHSGFNLLAAVVLLLPADLAAV